MPFQNLANMVTAAVPRSF